MTYKLNKSDRKILPYHNLSVFVYALNTSLIHSLTASKIIIPNIGYGLFEDISCAVQTFIKFQLHLHILYNRIVQYRNYKYKS